MAPGAISACSYASPVGVAVDLNAPMLYNRLWDDSERHQTEAELRVQLAQEADVFPYWCYASNPRPNTFALIFKLVQEHNEMHVQVSLAQMGSGPGDEPGSIGQPRKSLLWKVNGSQAEASKLERMERADRVEYFRSAFRDHLLTKSAHKNYLIRLLQDHVPVADTGIWRTEDRPIPSVILPLPWKDQFTQLYLSTFLLNCFQEGRDWKEIEAKGWPEAALYPIAANAQQGPYKAVQVVPLSNRKYPDDLTAYEPKRVLLQKIVHVNAGSMMVANFRGPR